MTFAWFSTTWPSGPSGSLPTTTRRMQSSARSRSAPSRRLPRRSAPRRRRSILRSTTRGNASSSDARSARTRLSSTSSPTHTCCARRRGRRSSTPRRRSTRKCRTGRGGDCRQGVRVARRALGRRERTADSRRDRLHLGARPAPFPQASPRVRATVRRCALPRAAARRGARLTCRGPPVSESAEGDFDELGLLDGAGIRGAAPMDARVRRGGDLPGRADRGGDRQRRTRADLEPLPERQGAGTLGGPPAARAGRSGLRPGEARTDERDARRVCIYAPNVFGCQAPDSGNSEILALAGTPEQKERWLHPLLDRRAALRVLDDRARDAGLGPDAAPVARRPGRRRAR